MEIKPPAIYEIDPIIYTPTIYLGGSNDNWRTNAISDIYKQIPTAVIYNPSREQIGIDVAEQVKWELDAQEEADVRFYYFSSDIESSITFLEIGLFGGQLSTSTVICVEPGFKLAVDLAVVCGRYGIEFAVGLNNGLTTVIDLIKNIGSNDQSDELN